MSSPTIAAPSGQSYYVCVVSPANTTMQTPAQTVWLAAPSESNSKGIPMTTDFTKADPLVLTNVNSGVPNLVTTSFGTTYNWTSGGDISGLSGGFTIQSNSSNLSSGENYMFVESGQESSNTKPMYYSQESSDPYKSTFFLEAVDVAPADGTPVCFAAGFFIKYMWDSTDRGNVWYLSWEPGWTDALDASFQTSKPIPSSDPNSFGLIFYLVPVAALAPCSGATGTCNPNTPPFDVLNASGAWSGALASAGCALTYNGSPVVYASDCSTCPQFTPPAPGSVPPTPGGNPVIPPAPAAPDSPPSPANSPSPAWLSNLFHNKYFWLAMVAVFFAIVLLAIYGHYRRSNSNPSQDNAAPTASDSTTSAPSS